MCTCLPRHEVDTWYPLSVIVNFMLLEFIDKIHEVRKSQLWVQAFIATRLDYCNAELYRITYNLYQ